MYDVIIVGADVSGAAPTRELSRYKVSACVLEREEDVCCGTSKANSAVAHTGYDAVEGSFMARLNMEGNQIVPELARELDFPFNPYGFFVVYLDEESLLGLRALYERGVRNGVKGLETITDKARIKEMELNLTDEVTGVLYAPMVDIVCPFSPNIALTEDAYTDSVNSEFNTEVTDTRRIEGRWALEANQGMYETRCVINAAGVHVDKLHNAVSRTKIHITPRRGDYCLPDKSAGDHTSHTIFALPSKYGKGALVSLAVHGNLIVGSTTIDIENKEATAATREGLDELIAKAGMNVKDPPMYQVIISFTRLRAHKDHYEFIIKGLRDTPGFVDCAGVESPGLTSRSVIGRMVVGILKEKLELESNTWFNDSRKGVLGSDTFTEEEQAKLIKQSPTHGNIICRCKMVTEGEILDTIHGPLGACFLDGIKHRTRAEMGRCQAGFCIPRSIELLHRELGLPMTGITKADGDSKLVVGTNGDRIQKEVRAK